MATVSIIVPNYNHAAYLPQRIAGILRQTYTNYEVLLLDDASTDDSLAIMQSYQDHPAVRVIVNPQNSGSPFAQWNKGVALAQGELIWIAEADDVAEPDFLKKLTSVLLNNPQVGLVYCQSLYVDEHNEIFGTPLNVHRRLNQELWNNDFIMHGQEMLASYMVIKNVIPNASAVVFRKHLFETIGGAAGHLKIAGDWMTWARMLLISDIGYIAEPLNYFRVHSATVRRKIGRQQQILECVDVQQYIYTHISVPQESKRKVIFELLKYFWQRPERPKPGEFTIDKMLRLVKVVAKLSNHFYATFFFVIGVGSLGVLWLFPSMVTVAQKLYQYLHHVHDDDKY